VKRRRSGYGHLPGKHGGHLRGIEYAGAPGSATDTRFFAQNFPKDFAKIRFARKSHRRLHESRLAGPRCSHIPVQVGLGLKPISNVGTIRLIKAAIEYALRERRRSVTLVHKGTS